MVIRVTCYHSLLLHLYFCSGKDDSESLLITAIAALQLFVQHNWTGPVTLTKQHLADLMELDLSVSDLALN